MRDPRALLSLVALALALALTGCPKEPVPDRAPAATTSASTPPGPTATGATTQAPPAQTTQASPPFPPVQAAGPGPAGPAGPRQRTTPGTEDGRDQLDLLTPRPIQVGAVPVQAWIADTTERRQLGLMNVRALPKDHGMVFVYPRARRMAFWMHNTLIPLTIAYITDDGTIAQIEDMQAMDESTHPSTGVVRFALEMPLHWYAEHGIHPGDRVDGIVELEGYGE